MAIEMMQTAFRAARIAMHIEVVGAIVGSRAMLHSGRRLTLMDIYFGALLSDETALKAPVGQKPDSVAEMT